MDWAGRNLGGVTHQAEMPDANPFGIANLDIDSEGLDFDLTPFHLMIRRRGVTNRAQYLFRVMDPASQLVFSPHGTHDVCTWQFVLPGSVHETGSLYELWIKEEGEWVLWEGQTLDLSLLPVLDPDQYRVTPDLPAQMDSKANAAMAPRRLKVVRRSRRTRDTPTVLVKASGSLKSRIAMAKFYLKRIAWRSVSGFRGHNALLVAAANVRLFHDLPKEIGIRLLKDHFNPKCIDRAGNPAPWSDKEIEHKWNQAGKPGMYSTLGASAPKAVAKVRAVSLQVEVEKFLAAFTVPGGRCNPTLLLDAFLVWRCGEEVNATAFGRAVTKATGIPSSSPGGPRMRIGFSLSSDGLKLITHGLAASEGAA